jgi:hypothetical protein
MPLHDTNILIIIVFITIGHPLISRASLREHLLSSPAPFSHISHFHPDNPRAVNMGGGGPALPAPTVVGGYLSGRKLIYPLALVISLFFLWGFSYGASEYCPHSHQLTHCIVRSLISC